MHWRVVSVPRLMGNACVRSWANGAGHAEAALPAQRALESPVPETVPSKSSKYKLSARYPRVEQNRLFVCKKNVIQNSSRPPHEEASMHNTAMNFMA